MRRYGYNDSSLKSRRQSLRKSQTDTELFLWQNLRDRQLKGCKFYRQYSVGSYILDFYCPKARLALELDGGQHVENQDYDNQRTVFLNEKGITVLRFWNNQVLQSLNEVLARIWEVLP